MLERASTCLDTGLRLSLRAGRRTPKSCRLLHSSFWNHGAGDLELPPWAMPVNNRLGKQGHRISKPGEGDSSDTQCSALPEGLFLDFLYPPQALAFMARSSGGADRRERRQQARSTVAGLRGYSSMTKSAEGQSSATQQAHQFGEEEDGDELFADSPGDVLDKPKRVMHQSQDNQDKHWVTRASDLLGQDSFTPFTTKKSTDEELARVMRDDMGKTATLRAWALYNSLDHKNQTELSTKRALLVWFGKQENEAAADYALRLFESLDDMSRDAPTYQAAVAAALQTGDVKRAIKMHESASLRPQSGSFGSNFLLKYAVKNLNWTLALKIWQQFQEHNERVPLGERNSFTLLVFGISDIPRFYAKIKQLRDHQNELVPNDPLRPRLEVLLESLVDAFVHDLRYTPGLRHPDMHRRIRELMISIHESRIVSWKVYEQCLKQLSTMHSHANCPGCFQLISQIYGLYARTDNFSPSVSLLGTLVQYWSHRSLETARPGKSHSLLTIAKIRRDWNRSHGAVDQAALFSVMKFFARRGRVEELQTYATEYRDNHQDKAGYETKLWPLIFVHAVRKAPADALKQLQRLKEDYGVEPDLRCWNIVIFSYQRANDLDGGLRAFEQLCDSGLEPDRFSFGPILSMYGRQGDVDGATNALDLAAGYNIRPSTLMLNGLVLAHATSGDIEAAEEALSVAAKQVEKGEAVGSLTACYNTVISGRALHRDIEKTMKIYRQMRDENVPLDGNTYAALLQSLCLFRQPESAHKILTTIMPAKDIRPSAFHYTIVMNGYIRQGRYDEALQLHRAIGKNQVRPSVGSNMAYLKAKALSEHAAKSDDSEEYSAVPLRDTIKELLKLLDSPEPMPFLKGPDVGSRHATSQTMGVGYFEFMIYIHGVRQCYLAAHELFLTYTKRMHTYQSPDDAPPIRLLTALMSVHMRAGEYNEVCKYWDLAKTQADQIRRLPSPPLSVAKPPTADPAAPSIPGLPSPIPTPTEERNAPALRFLLSRPLRFYLIALSSASPPDISRMTSTIASLLSSGYALDNRTWNAYIIHLCRASPPRALLAFSLVERFMMPNWPGWTHANGVIETGLYGPHKSARAEGLEFIRARYLSPDVLIPQYKTMVHLAGALLEVRRREASGGGATSGDDGEVAAQVGTFETIRRFAPKTLRAVQSMPKVYDRLQRKLIRRGEE